MEFKNVVKQVMENQETRLQIKNSNSFDEVLTIFQANGYEGNAKELNKELSKNTLPLQKIGDDDLTNIAGGVSGRKILAACASIMMLTGSLPSTNLMLTPSYVVSAKETTSNTIDIPKERYSKLSRKQVLRLEKLYAMYGFLFLGIMCDADSKPSYTTAFLMTELEKNSAEILEILSEKDYSECRKKLDELLSSTDFNNFDSDKFSEKATKICDSYGLSDDITNKLYDSPIQDNVDNAYKELWFQRITRRRVVKSLKSSLDDYKKALSNSTSLNEEVLNYLEDTAVEGFESHLKLLNLM